MRVVRACTYVGGAIVGGACSAGQQRGASRASRRARHAAARQGTAPVLRTHSARSMRGSAKSS